MLPVDKHKILWYREWGTSRPARFSEIFQSGGYNRVMNNFFGHLKTVIMHKHLVFKYCCRVGIPLQGLVHDLSKFSPAEFRPSVHYFKGTSSPIGAERREKGYSSAWLHHKAINKHHWEYWVEFRDDGTEYYVKMPMRFVKEMLCDWLSAGKTYNRKTWQQHFPLDYFHAHESYYKLNPETKAFALKVLEMIKSEGEDAALDWLRKQKDY